MKTIVLVHLHNGQNIKSKIIIKIRRKKEKRKSIKYKKKIRKEIEDMAPSSFSEELKKKNI